MERKKIDEEIKRILWKYESRHLEGEETLR